MKNDSIEKLSSVRGTSRAELNLAKRHPEVNHANISIVLDLGSTDTYNNFTYVRDKATLRSDLSGT